ncbi:iron complex transport system substrate-binding protein [Alkalibacillus flavidus]|uniref:Iron complex transport system substrate-binding protein n=2 Tax=Alkalibacillus flavidus TaxID=546021 RepID=A0ABV2KZD7_9BACI
MLGKMKQWVLIVLLVLVVGLTACQNGEESTDDTTSTDNTEQQESEENTSDENDDDNSEASEESESTFPVTITDRTDQEITIEEKPESIVSVIPSATEIVYAVGAGDAVDGVSQWADYPKEVNDVETVGDMNLNIEKIVSLEPDLVVADVQNADDIDAMRDAGLNVLVIGSQSLDAVYRDIEMVGQATGHMDQAKDIVSDMRSRVSDVKDAVSDIPEEERKRVWVEVGPQLFSGAQGSFLHEILTLAGGLNIIGDQEGWPQVSEEVIIEQNPDVIITTYGETTENAHEKIMNRDGWDTITAVQEEAIYDMKNNLLSRPGPRLVDGLEELARILYPNEMN